MWQHGQKITNAQPAQPVAPDSDQFVASRGHGYQ